MPTCGPYQLGVEYIEYAEEDTAKETLLPKRITIDEVLKKPIIDPEDLLEALRQTSAKGESITAFSIYDRLKQANLKPYQLRVIILYATQGQNRAEKNNKFYIAEEYRVLSECVSKILNLNGYLPNAKI